MTSEITGGRVEIHSAERTQEDIQRRGPETVELERENIFVASFDSRSTQNRLLTVPRAQHFTLTPSTSSATTTAAPFLLDGTAMIDSGWNV